MLLRPSFNRKLESRIYRRMNAAAAGIRLDRDIHALEAPAQIPCENIPAVISIHVLTVKAPLAFNGLLRSADSESCKVCRGDSSFESKPGAEPLGQCAVLHTLPVSGALVVTDADGVDRHFFIQPHHSCGNRCSTHESEKRRQVPPQFDGAPPRSCRQRQAAHHVDAQRSTDDQFPAAQVPLGLPTAIATGIDAMPGCMTAASWTSSKSSA